jgi:hypothetical protein
VSDSLVSSSSTISRTVGTWTPFVAIYAGGPDAQAKQVTKENGAGKGKEKKNYAGKEESNPCASLHQQVSPAAPALLMR